MRPLGAILCLLVLLPSAGGAGTGTSTVTLWPAKTNQRVFALGTVSPARPGEVVTVKLLRDSGDGFVRITTAKAELSRPRDQDGNGSQESHYVRSFDRPRTGTCKLVAVHRRQGVTAGRSTETFPCAIPDFASGSATITSSSGLVEVRLEIAETPEQHGYGLMYRRWLAADRGMAFLFEQDTRTSFYMQNTLIPLSIAFFDQGGRILKIMDMQPCDDGPCPLYDPEVSFRGALEVNQGAFEAWGVTEGDIIRIYR